MWRNHKEVLKLLRMTDKIKSFTVKHDSARKEFYIDMKADEDSSEAKAVLQYDWLKDNHVDMYHTEVPPVFRGKGVGKILAKAAVDHFVEQKIKMSPTCTFIQKYVRENPRDEFTDLVVTQ